MTRPPGGEAEPPDGAGPGADWATIWRSEMNALSADREPAEAWCAALALWEAWARAAKALIPQGLPPNGAGRGPDGCAGSAQAARPAASVAAPDDGRQMARTEQLARRVAELERRLAELERP